MIPKLRIESLILLLAIIAAQAQELPGAGILVDGKIPKGFYKAGIRYGEAKGDSIYIRWSHATEADTFWVYKANSNLEYITNSSIRTVWYHQPFKYERRMATHHLREYILESPLKFSNLEELAKNSNSQFLEKNLNDFFVK
jgi:hypothetical protein